MKRFKFRLQRVLDYRDGLKKEGERNLAQTNHQLRNAENQLETVLARQDQAQLDESECTMAEVLALGAYQERLQNELIQQRLLVLEAADAVDAARDIYLERAIEAEILENLKTRRRVEWQEECRKHERKRLNESIVQRHRFTKPLAKKEDI